MPLGRDGMPGFEMPQQTRRRFYVALQLFQADRGEAPMLQCWMSELKPLPLTDDLTAGNLLLELGGPLQLAGCLPKRLAQRWPHIRQGPTWSYCMVIETVVDSYSLALELSSTCQVLQMSSWSASTLPLPYVKLLFKTSRLLVKFWWGAYGNDTCIHVLTMPQFDSTSTCN